MKLENFICPQGAAGASGLVYACGSFGVVNRMKEVEVSQEENVTTYRYRQNGALFTSVFTEEKEGVVIREDCLENTTDKPMEVTAFCNRFCLDGNEYQVYTQYNAWQHESKGLWQDLITEVRAASQGIRPCDGAAPMMALYNKHSRRIAVFHLFVNAQWQIKAKKLARNQKEHVLVETGLSGENLHLILAPGECVSLPEVWFYSAKNKVDLDAYKLHLVYNRRYPRKKTPVVYNSWLYCFDHLDIDDLMRQADAAAELGIEAFMIDAGWFGSGEDWSDEVGDWVENTVSGPKGRLGELSRHVRQKGMTFGLWFEPERASPKSKAVKEHPEFYLEGRLFDFSRPDAVEYMSKVIGDQIEKYKIGWVKFDFNGTTPVALSGDCFYRYMQGQRQFVENIKKRFPELYITNCASGGYRMELAQGTFTDSFWLSDNQGPYEGIRIVKDTLKRMPTALIERWNVQQYSKGFPAYGKTEPVGVMFSCNNATWDFIINVKDSFSRGFLQAGPMGFSCDLAGMPEEYRQMWKEHIALFKQDRDFYAKATARILADSEDIIAIEYADEALERCVIQLFAKVVCAKSLVLTPVVDERGSYWYKQELRRGIDLGENGILFDDLQDNSCYTVELRKAKEEK